MIKPAGEPQTGPTYYVDPAGREAVMVLGLVSLGLLLAGEVTFSGGANLFFAKITAKLISLLGEAD